MLNSALRHRVPCVVIRYLSDDVGSRFHTKGMSIILGCQKGATEDTDFKLKQTIIASVMCSFSKITNK